MSYHRNSDKDQFLIDIVNGFKDRTQLSSIEYEVKENLFGPYLIIHLANPTERFFRLLNETLAAIPEDNPYRERTTLKERSVAPEEPLHMPEVQRLQTVLSESLTVTRYSFEDDFLDRYIHSVSNEEERIIANANHIVYGRRGAGKSSLLAYLLHKLEQEGVAYAWVDMQAYAGGGDSHVIADVLLEIIGQLCQYSPNHPELESIKMQLTSVADAESDQSKQIDRLLPKIKRAIFPLTKTHGRVVIFLDDFHAIDKDLQPVLLGKLYSICRGNKIFLKISGIEQFTKKWDPSSRQGLESTGDVQEIQLDHNLTMPDKSKAHIQKILNAHAIYCGLPDIKYICNPELLSRLVLTAAAVPRDALNIFAKAITCALVKDRKKVTITSVNEAAAKMTEEKRRDLEQLEENKLLFEEIKRFCLDKKHKNAFLVEIQNDNLTFNRIKELIALRLLHIIHEGIAPYKAGQRFMALMLDYGFYVGIRTAQSVTLFLKEPRQLQAKELRGLPVFKLPEN